MAQIALFSIKTMKIIHDSVHDSGDSVESDFQPFKYGNILVPQKLIQLLRNLSKTKDGFIINDSPYVGSLNFEVETIDEKHSLLLKNGEKFIYNVFFSRVKDEESILRFLFFFQDECKITIKNLNLEDRYKDILQKKIFITKPSLLRKSEMSVKV